MSSSKTDSQCLKSTIFLSGFKDYPITEREIYNITIPFGEVKFIKVIHSLDKNRCFVEYLIENDAFNSVQNLNGFEFSRSKGIYLKVTFANKEYLKKLDYDRTKPIWINGINENNQSENNVNEDENKDELLI